MFWLRLPCSPPASSVVVDSHDLSPAAFRLRLASAGCRVRTPLVQLEFPSQLFLVFHQRHLEGADLRFNLPALLLNGPDTPFRVFALIDEFLFLARFLRDARGTRQHSTLAQVNVLQRDAMPGQQELA